MSRFFRSSVIVCIVNVISSGDECTGHMADRGTRISGRYQREERSFFD